MISYLEHHGILGQKWGVHRSESQLTGGKKEKSISKSQVKKNARSEARQKNKEEAKKFVEQNNKRIVSEINAYDAKHGGNFAKKFFERYDDLEMWDLYSPEELMAGL